ncbi:hypothetical protein FDP41_007443 [Naegleria fowleri]|uniref:Uncharacterized protein n=1 Tax=Naegleria fowleri TaxID=5763 RepID=A0A6A5C927_NAEFO|nr:uncharacterized protein FDP41_007443 [Naegleria fowleri]KAF0984266.1 hypothetical protein FDP41_007443 [Naegleria fowleri]
MFASEEPSLSHDIHNSTTTTTKVHTTTTTNHPTNSDTTTATTPSQPSSPSSSLLLLGGDTNMMMKKTDSSVNSVSSSRNATTTTNTTNNNNNTHSTPVSPTISISSSFPKLFKNSSLTPRSAVERFVHTSTSTTNRNSLSNRHNSIILGSTGGEHANHDNLQKIFDKLNTIGSTHQMMKELLDAEIKGNQNIQEEIIEMRNKFEETKEEITKMNSRLAQELESNKKQMSQLVSSLRYLNVSDNNPLNEDDYDGEQSMHGDSSSTISSSSVINRKSQRLFNNSGQFLNNQVLSPTSNNIVSTRSGASSNRNSTILPSPSPFSSTLLILLFILISLLIILIIFAFTDAGRVMTVRKPTF